MNEIVIDSDVTRGKTGVDARKTVVNGGMGMGMGMGVLWLDLFGAGTCGSCGSCGACATSFRAGER